jgi:hypothetical protein
VLAGEPLPEDAADQPVGARHKHAHEEASSTARTLAARPIPYRRTEVSNGG